MCKPKFIFLIWSELIFEAQGEIRFYSFSGTIIVIQESIVVIQIAMYTYLYMDACMVHTRHAFPSLRVIT